MFHATITLKECQDELLKAHESDDSAMVAQFITPLLSLVGEPLDRHRPLSTSALNNNNINYIIIIIIIINIIIYIYNYNI